MIDLAAVPGDGKVKLTYQIPLDVDHVVITRSTSSGAAAEVVYSGSANTYTDASLENGVEYRYVVRTVDASGNRSAGVAIIGVPRRNMLLEPKDGAKLVKPPKLVWAADVEADYYNVQLLRNGVRILSVWPSKTKTRFVLKKTWRYQGRTYTLRSGRYEWFVWPGFGSREASNYGLLLGARTFQIVR